MYMDRIPLSLVFSGLSSPSSLSLSLYVGVLQALNHLHGNHLVCLTPSSLFGIMCKLAESVLCHVM